jgi:hypothetical protein
VAKRTACEDRGDPYAPAFVERFTIISGNTLKLFYMFATWNPYAVVMMEWDFNIAYGPVVSEVANAEGESPAIAPNTWVEIKGVNRVPAGPTQINVLTPPGAMNGPVQVVVTDGGTVFAAFTVQAQPISPSFFVFDGGPYVAATDNGFTTQVGTSIAIQH